MGLVGSHSATWANLGRLGANERAGLGAFPAVLMPKVMALQTRAAGRGDGEAPPRDQADRGGAVAVPDRFHASERRTLSCIA